MELIVIVAVVGFFGLLMLIALPRGRETARSTACQRNLMQIGMGLQLYVQASRQYPQVPPLGQPGASTIRSLLDNLALPDFLDLRDPTTAAPTGPVPPTGSRVPGLVCPSDPNTDPRIAPTGLSYRANAGDQPQGSTGPFAAGVRVTPAQVEAANGLSYTAGFAERLLGTGQDGEPGPMNYQLTTGPITGAGSTRGTRDAAWRGDAGSSWAEPGWRSGLYTHLQRPNAPLTFVASDGRSANITASSGHPDRIHVSLLDGSVRAVRPTIDDSVWHRLGSIESPAHPNPETEPRP